MRSAVRRGLAMLALCLGMLVACNRVAPLVAVTAPGSILGDAQMRRGGTQVWTRLAADTILYVGDSLRALAPAQIVFLDGTSFFLEKDTSVEIKAFDPHRTELALSTVVAELSIEDAQAEIHISEDSADVRVTSGLVRVNSGSKSQQVRSGEALRVTAGKFERYQIAAALSATSTVPIPSPTLTMVAPQVLAATWVAATASPTPTATRTSSPRPTLTRTATYAEPGITPAVVSLPNVQASSSPTATPVPPTATAEAPPPTSTPRPALVIRVNCGGVEYKDTQGRTWATDRQYVEGSWGYTGGKVYTTGNAIAKTRDDLLYQSERWGDFFYLFDIPNGRYQVTLLFAEIYRDDPGVRQFGVRLEGQSVLSDLDLAAVAGRDVAYSQSFTVDLHDKQLGIEFIKQMDFPKVNAIEVSSVR